MPQKTNDPFGSIVPPLYLGVTYAHDSPESAQQAFDELGCGYAYGRMGNPTVTEFEAWLADLEGGSPRSAWATSTGLSALSLLTLALTSERSGGNRRIVTSLYIYGGSFHQLESWRDDHGFEVVFVDNPFSLDSWEDAIRPGAAFVFLEVPCNPTVDVFDIGKIARIARQHGTWLVVDNTLGVALQKPLLLGADVVLHSTTKAINRQSTGLGGALVAGPRFLNACEDIIDDYQVALGSIMHPLSAWLALNNRFTLVRDMETFSKNALAVARFLEAHPCVRKVHYPFLESSRSYETARIQMRGGGGLLSFELDGFEEAKRLIALLEKAYLAPHLGDVRNLVIHPASTTHGKLCPEGLRAVNISPEMVRLSVGLGEDEPQALIEDLNRALGKI